MGEPARSEEGRVQAVRLTAYLVFAVALVVLLRNAWVCDDAYISFRSSFNLVEGHGLTWNPGERVQAFTNPLWTLAMALLYALSGDLYYPALALGLACTLAAGWLLCRRVAIAPTAALLVAAILLSSKSFVDWSTSGMENAATHLLVVVFALVYLAPAEARPNRRRLLWLGLLAAGLMLNRLDTVLLVLPALVHEGWRQRRSGALRWLALGLAPIAAWELFSLFYYGFPLPNTYYAKLHNDVPHREQLVQGWLYLVDSLSRDPITLAAIGVATALALASRARADLELLAGGLVYLLYVVWIGGDHMSGRFLSAPLVVAMIALARSPAAAVRPHALVAVVVAVVLSAALPYSPLRAGPNYGSIEDTNVRGLGVNDERRFYFDEGSLLSGTVNQPLPRGKWVEEGLGARRDGGVIERTGVGYFAVFAGPDVHVIDRYALADPLLARLPPIWKSYWRPGHFMRDVPAGYRASLDKDADLLEDERLAAYYRRVRLVTRGPLWSWARLRAIWELNTGQLDDLIDKTWYQFPVRRRMPLDRLALPRERGTPWDAAGNVRLDDGQMLVVDLGKTSHAPAIEISVDDNDEYRVVFLADRRELGSRTISGMFDEPLWDRRTPPSRGLIVRRVDVPSAAVDRGYDQIRVCPLREDGKYAVGHLLLIDR